MDRFLPLLLALPLVPSLACAQLSNPANAPAEDAKIDYVGGLTICAENPKALALWYTEKFGLKIDQHYGPIWYGTIPMNGGDLNMGIHPVSTECRRVEKGFTITFHVDGYARYLAKLKSRGVEPVKTEDSGRYGTFAYFSDPENNTVAIWGK